MKLKIKINKFQKKNKILIFNNIKIKIWISIWINICNTNNNSILHNNRFTKTLNFNRIYNNYAQTFQIIFKFMILLIENTTILQTIIINFIKQNSNIIN